MQRFRDKEELVSEPSSKGKEWAVLIFAIIVALATAYFAQFAIPVDTRMFYTMGVFPWMLALFLAICFKKCFGVIDQVIVQNVPGFVVTVLLGLTLSAFVVQGAQLTGPEFYDPFAPELLIAVVFVAVPIVCGLQYIWSHLPLTGKPFLKIPPIPWNLAVFFVLLLCWLPYFFASYPGLFCYDMGGEEGEYGSYLLGEVTSHLPLLHTLFVGSIVDLGMGIWGDYNSGIALLTCVQAVIIAAIFTFCIAWMRKNDAGRGVIIGSIIYFALNPVISLFITCTTRDTLFSAVAVLVALFAYDALALSNSKPRRIKTLICLGISCLLLCLLRNNGLYGFILFAVILVLAAKEHRWSIVVIYVCVVTLAVLWIGPISEGMSVDKENDQKKESLALPIQHLAYLASTDALSDSERGLLENLGYDFPDEQKYRAKISDPSKNTIRRMTSDGVAEAYFAIAPNHIAECWYAELSRTQDLWNPYSYADCYNGYQPYYDDKDTSFFGVATEAPGEMQTMNPDLLSFMREIGGGLMLQQTPLASILVCLPFYFVLMLLVLARAIIVRDRRAFGALSIFAALALTAYLGPCVLPRYYMYLYFAVPLFAFFLLSMGNRDNDQDASRVVGVDGDADDVRGGNRRKLHRQSRRAERTARRKAARAQAGVVNTRRIDVPDVYPGAQTQTAQYVDQTSVPPNGERYGSYPSQFRQQAYSQGSQNLSRKRNKQR